MGWRDWTRRTIPVPLARPIDGWRAAGDDVYTCVAPPGYEKDPAVTAAIRSFDPDIIPAWRIQLWFPPRTMEILRVVHHGIMRHYAYPKNLRQRFHVELPQGWDGPEPNLLDVFFSDERKTNLIGPGAYMPWDWHVYRYCRNTWIILTSDVYRERVERHRERMRQEHERQWTEIDYRRRHFEKTAMPMLEKLTPADWAEYNELLRTRGRSARRKQFAVPGSPPGT